MDRKGARAWEMARKIFEESQPNVRPSEEQTWGMYIDVGAFHDQSISLDWGSNVPGSGAPESIMVAAVQSLENRGYLVSDDGYRYLAEGLEAYSKRDFRRLHMMSALLRRELAAAKKNPESGYWKYRCYSTLDDYLGSVEFPEAVPVDAKSKSFREKEYAGWLSQLIGGAMGTMVEGYPSGKLLDAFGEVYDFLTEPNTYNDDTTYELAFLEAFQEKGYDVTPEDIALSWVGLIPGGWSAEEIAIRNIKNGILPPESGTYRNPFCEWIGAQMRGGICGMVAPGDPRTAAILAWKDASVSHANNGIFGEVFVSVMTSLSFVETDVEKIVRTAIDMIPADCEYRSVVEFAWGCSHKHRNWRDALSECEDRYNEYNWIHAYPNACCLVIAACYGKGDFAETLHIATMCGLDADCNAGALMPVIGISRGPDSIPERYMRPAFEKLTTYMRGDFSEIPMDRLVDMTVDATAQAGKRKNTRIDDR
ncbi:MAG: ADP-ribosylglycohydrolase family protein [Candidatus Methanomethylophilaceae archaeon]|nr:ADP-ribosylglycohydrolase family protein [Candidatus Methanomethylophilaceae archaeon]